VSILPIPQTSPGAYSASLFADGGNDNARFVHFVAAMSVLAAFFVVHLVMVALAPRSLLFMIRGR
jgi:thiosulfate reductase cytochrome b subunit